VQPDNPTAIIDKVQASNSKIVALVLPKRATVLQSVVNMKLLKRAADNADKNLVLITSEAGLMPLAGAAGVYVAKNLQTKPEVPQPPDETVPADEPAEDVPESSEAETGEIDATQTVGELATKSTTQQPEETIEVDNDAPVEDAAGEGVAAGKAKKAKNKKDKKNKIPNFDQFRKRLFLIGGGIIALIVLCIFAFFVLPKAKVTIKTDTSSKDTQVNFTAWRC
jgi:type IV secretory pathway VirB10-like protein